MQHQQQLQNQDNRRPAVRSETPRLLLVDDEPRLRNSLRDLLRCIPLDVHCAGSGREAIALLQQHRFDLALLDLGLPDMSGHQIMDQIRAHG